MASNPKHYASAQKPVVDILPTDDAYVITDTNDPSDKLGLQNVNTGNLKFLDAFYAWNVTKSGHEKIISVIYLKFNLTNVKNDSIQDASLQLYPFKVNLTDVSRPIVVYTATNNTWNESNLVFRNAPKVTSESDVIPSTQISTVGNYVSWNVTSMAKSHAGSILTLALVLKDIYQHSQEQVVFYSKEADNPLTRPRLELSTYPSQNGELNTFDPVYLYLTIIPIAAIAGFVVLKQKKRQKLVSDKP